MLLVVGLECGRLDDGKTRGYVRAESAPKSTLYIGFSLCLEVDLRLVDSIEQGFRALLICPCYARLPCLEFQSRASKLRAPFRSPHPFL